MIEAAHKLPKWLQPDNSSNRVWLKQGAVHIIPFPNTPAQVGVIPVSVDIPTGICCLLLLLLLVAVGCVVVAAVPVAYVFVITKEQPCV